MYNFNSGKEIQYDFQLDGGRTNHLLSLVNNTSQPQQLKAIQIVTNADIQNPWQTLGGQWPKPKRQGNFYVYTLTLAQPITLNAGENKMLEYSVGDALGPITNVAMPPTMVNIQLTTDNQLRPISSIYTNNPQPDPHPGRRFRMYHANWGQYSYKRTMDNEQLADINDLTYAFIGFDEKGNVFSLDSWGDQLELPKLALKQQQYPHLQSSISFGGWTNKDERMDTVFSQMAANPDARKKFVKNAVAAAIQAGVNGIDIDWEYVKAADVNNFIALLQELRTELNNSGIVNPRLSIAAPASAENVKLFSKEQWKIISSLLDGIAIMDYDYYGGFSEFADFHSPWELSPNSPYFTNGDSDSKTLALYEEMGVPKDKIKVGFPNYTRSVIVDKPGKYAGLYQPVVGSPKGDFGQDGGVFGWNTIWKFLNKQPSELDKLGVKQWYFYDSNHDLCKAAGMCLLTGQLPDGRWVVINFLDPESAKRRAQKVISMGYGGVMMWANYNETEDPKNSITRATSLGMDEQNQLVASQTSATNPTVAPAFDPRKLKKTPLSEALSVHTQKMREAFFAEGKYHILNRLSTITDAKAMKDFLKLHRKELGHHRNVFKRAIAELFSHDVAIALFGKPRSLEVAENYLTFYKMVQNTAPTAIICRDDYQPALTIKGDYHQINASLLRQSGDRVIPQPPNTPYPGTNTNPETYSVTPPPPPPPYPGNSLYAFLPQNQSTITPGYQPPSAPPLDETPQFKGYDNN